MSELKLYVTDKDFGWNHIAISKKNWFHVFCLRIHLMNRMIWDVFAPPGRPEGLRRTNEPLASRPNVRQKRTESVDLRRVCSCHRAWVRRGMQNTKSQIAYPTGVWNAHSPTAKTQPYGVCKTATARSAKRKVELHTHGSAFCHLWAPNGRFWRGRGVQNTRARQRNDQIATP